MPGVIRTCSVIDIFNRYEQEVQHAKQVKKLALIIFDKTNNLIHTMSVIERELLEAGALLHDIGYVINSKNHNKHSYKLITKERPTGFSNEEIEIMANVARYHRGKLPNNRHESFAHLSLKGKQSVCRLAAFARLADALDRTHNNVIKDIDFFLDSFSSVLFLTLKLNIPDCSYEINRAMFKKDLFEREFGINIQFRTSID